MSVQKHRVVEADPKNTCKKVGNIIIKGVDKYKILSVLASGSYGPIYLARLQTHPYSYHVVKSLSKKIIFNSNKTQELIPFHIREIQLHSALQHHANIVQLDFICETFGNYYIGMEYCCYGDLYDAITTTTDITHPWHHIKGNHCMINKAFMEILDGLIHMHENGVYHRDLKPENIFIGNNGKLKIADFGLATLDYWSSEFGCGSSFYMSPELQDKDFSYPGRVFRYYNETGDSIYCTAHCDIWALGIIFINLCFGRNPWKTATMNDPTFAAFVENPGVLFELFPLTFEGYSIVVKMLELDPSKRTSLYWLKKIIGQDIKYFYDSNDKNLNTRVFVQNAKNINKFSNQETKGTAPIPKIIPQTRVNKKMDLNLNPTDSLLNFEDKSALFMPLVPEKETLSGNRYLSNSTLNDRMVNYFINKRVNLRDCSFNTKSSACKGIEDKNDNGSGKIGGGINRQDYSCTNSDKYSHSGRDVGGTMSEDRNGGGAEAFGSYSTQNSSHNKYMLLKADNIKSNTGKGDPYIHTDDSVNTLERIQKKLINRQKNQWCDKDIGHDKVKQTEPSLAFVSETRNGCNEFIEPKVNIVTGSFLMDIP